MVSTPEERLKFRRVGWAKRSVPRLNWYAAKTRVGTGQDAPLPTLRSFGAWPRNFRRSAACGMETERAAERSIPPGKRASSTQYEGRTHDNSGSDARRARRARRLPCIRRPQRRTDDRQAGGHSRPPRGRQGHALAARVGSPGRPAANSVGRGELRRFTAKRLCEVNVQYRGMKNPA